MTRNRRAVVALVAPVVLVLSACAGHAGAGEPAQPTAIASLSEPAGIARDLVYVTDVDGFELATQSVGVMGDDGMSAVYVKAGGGGAGTVTLTTSRQPDPTAVPCAELTDASTGALRCVVDRGGAHVVLEGADVDPATLRAAAEAVRVPAADELGHLFTDVPKAGPPVERGDLPSAGDGAPLNPSGAGG